MEDTEEEIERQRSEQERRRESRRRSRRYTREERFRYYEWTERFKNKSSGEVLPVNVPPGAYIIDQIFCTGDKRDTKGLYLVGWIHPDPKKSYKPSWQLPRDVPREEIKLYKEQGVITETQYDGLLDYLEDYGLLPNDNNDDEGDNEDSNDEEIDDKDDNEVNDEDDNEDNNDDDDNEGDSDGEGEK